MTADDEMTPAERELLHGTGDPAKLSGIGDVQGVGALAYDAEMRQHARDVTARHAGQTDPTAEQKLDRLLARNALTSLGKRHPANVSRAERRAAGMREPLHPMHAELKTRAVQRRREDGDA